MVALPQRLLAYAVNVKALPAPTIASGPNDVCINSTGNVYTTQAGKTNYVWTVSSGGTITAGGTATDNTVTVTWTTAGARVLALIILKMVVQRQRLHLTL